MTASLRAADEGWVIERFHSEIDIGPDGKLSTSEAIDVDFRGLSKHGIFRDLDDLFDYDATQSHLPHRPCLCDRGRRPPASSEDR